MAHRGSPLLDIALGIARESITTLSNGQIDEMKQLLEGYIRGICDYTTVSSFFQRKYGITTPVEKVKEILSVNDDPLPVIPRYLNDLGLRKKTQPWTPLEDTRLIAALHRYGMDNWTLVAHFVGNGRTRSQCSQRWQRGLDPRISRSHWTKEEEEKLVELVTKLGDKSWIRVAKEMGNRSDVQCRYRYLQLQKEMLSSPAPQAVPSEPKHNKESLSFDLEMQLHLDALFGNLGALFDF